MGNKLYILTLINTLSQRFMLKKIYCRLPCKRSDSSPVTSDTGDRYSLSLIFGQLASAWLILVFSSFTHIFFTSPL